MVGGLRESREGRLGRVLVVVVWRVMGVVVRRTFLGEKCARVVMKDEFGQMSMREGG